MSPELTTDRSYGSAIQDLLVSAGADWNGFAPPDSDFFEPDAVNAWEGGATVISSQSSLRSALLDHLGEEALSELARYGRFPPRWDGYRAPQFEVQVLETARAIVELALQYLDSTTILPREITPGPASDGSIDIEIATSERCVIFTIYPELGALEIFRSSSRGRETLTAPLRRAALVRQLAWLGG